MIDQLIAHILQVNLTTGLSGNLQDSAGNYQMVYHQRVWQGNDEKAVVYTVLDELTEYCKGSIAMMMYDVSFGVFSGTDSDARYIANQLVQIVEGWSGTYDGKHWHYTTLTRKVEGFNDFFEMPTLVVDFQFASNE